MTGLQCGDVVETPRKPSTGLKRLLPGAIAGRLTVLEGDLDAILDDLLPRIAPT